MIAGRQRAGKRAGAPIGWARWLGISALVLGAVTACTGSGGGDRYALAESTSASSGQETTGPEASTTASDAGEEVVSTIKRVTLIAGGDVSFGRDLGQKLMASPETNYFEALSGWFSQADIRFINLESPISDQKGETQSPWVTLVFNSPPESAAALSRANIDVVSTANNHAWDYGKKALFETIDRLDQVHIAHAGTGKSRAEAYAPTIVEKRGVRVAFLAVTGMWNQGLLKKHAGAEFVADADVPVLVDNIQKLRRDGKVDFVVVSYHGGVEFIDLPLKKTIDLAHAAVDAGADAVLGHHPHVTQGIEWRNGKPIVYSLGNLVMQMSEGRPKISGLVARLVFSSDGSPALWVCPLHFSGSVGKPLVGHKLREGLEKKFLTRMKNVSTTLGKTQFGPMEEDGCSRVQPPFPHSN